MGIWRLSYYTPRTHSVTLISSLGMASRFIEDTGTAAADGGWFLNEVSRVISTTGVKGTATAAAFDGPAVVLVLAISAPPVQMYTTQHSTRTCVHSKPPQSTESTGISLLFGKEFKNKSVHLQNCSLKWMRMLLIAEIFLFSSPAHSITFTKMLQEMTIPSQTRI